MQLGVVQFKRLRGRSLRELSDRGRQEFSKIGERLFGTPELSDDAQLWRGQLLDELAAASFERQPGNATTAPVHGASCNL